MVEIRHTTESDRDAVEAIYRDAFPDEDLVPLVRQLLDAGDAVVSLMAQIDGGPVGHVAFTRCAVGGVAAWLLAPLVVAPSHQRRGIGTALMRAGFERASDAGVIRVLVLGDPAYYGRVGFAREDAIAPPYALPPEYDGAWQSIQLDGGAAEVTGTLEVPAVWQDEKLWLP